MSNQHLILGELNAILSIVGLDMEGWGAVLILANWPLTVMTYSNSP